MTQNTALTLNNRLQLLHCTTQTTAGTQYYTNHSCYIVSCYTVWHRLQLFHSCISVQMTLYRSFTSTPFILHSDLTPSLELTRDSTTVWPPMEWGRQRAARGNTWRSVSVFICSPHLPCNSVCQYSRIQYEWSQYHCQSQYPLSLSLSLHPRWCEHISANCCGRGGRYIACVWPRGLLRLSTGLLQKWVCPSLWLPVLCPLCSSAVFISLCLTGEITFLLYLLLKLKPHSGFCSGLLVNLLTGWWERIILSDLPDATLYGIHISLNLFSFSVTLSPLYLLLFDAVEGHNGR